MNVINNSNARTTNVLDNLNQCKNFINMETNAIVTACAMTYFSMSSLNMAVDEVVPPNVLNGDDDSKRLWYHRHVKSMVSKYVMNTESEIFHNMVEGVRQQSPPKPRDIYNCRVCNKEYHYKKARENHEKKKHSYIHIDPPSTDLSQETEKSKSTDKSDYIYNYACVRLSMGLFVRNFDDAVREGDGQRIIRCWKYMTLLFKAYHHSKYAFAGLQLQANIYALCTPREAHRLMWNRTVNVNGQKGKNISLDLRLEHLNHILKEMLRNLGPNLNELTAARASHSLMFIEKMLRFADDEMGRHPPSGHHVIAKRESDFKELVNQFHMKGKVFCFTEGREYDKFPKFDRNVLSNINFKNLSDWINEHKKKLSATSNYI